MVKNSELSFLNLCFLRRKFSSSLYTYFMFSESRHAKTIQHTLACVLAIALDDLIL